VDHHMNKHTKHIACQTCHIPLYSKCSPTKIYWDWSTAGKEKAQEIKGKDGMPVYLKNKGSFVWKQALKPAYRWYNGTVKRYVLGDRINENGITELTLPVGSIDDASARIYPFKLHSGKQISDAVNKYLITPQIWEGFWKHWDWNKASEDGMKLAKLAYSGKYEFVETVMYWGLTHEVVPKEQALSCTHCHASLAKAPYCGKCHQERPGVDFRSLVTKRNEDVQAMFEKYGADSSAAYGDYIDFKALGYEGDPIEAGGGRFTKLPMIMKAEK